MAEIVALLRPVGMNEDDTMERLWT